MKREDVQSKIPGITKEQLDWLMDENGKDVTREKATATQLQTQLNEANAQLQTAKDGLKAFEGVNVAELQGKIQKLTADMAAQKDEFEFGAAIDGAISTPITTATTTAAKTVVQTGAALLAGIASLGTSLAGLPELDKQE